MVLGQIRSQSSLRKTNPIQDISPLLKKVARTFYYSLRYLPNAVREPLAVAYLLARWSDTVVDDAALPFALRQDLFLKFQDSLAAPDDSNLRLYMQKKIDNAEGHFKGGDLDLLHHAGFLIDRLQGQSSKNLPLIQEVLALIFEGQQIDLTYFDNRSEMVAFKTAADLDRYLYLVAGSVGVFWTKICFACLDDYAKQSVDDLLPLAISFGKALQLTNILKDLPRDLAQGRCYLPLAEPPQIADALIFSSSDQALISSYHDQALAYLADARFYISSVNDRRIRFALVVPLELAYKTLAALPVKISKTSVYFTVVSACWQSLGFLPRWRFF